MNYTKPYSWLILTLPEILLTAGLFPDDDIRSYCALGEIFIPGLREFEKSGEEGFPFPHFQ